jgi:hypothetical protein
VASFFALSALKKCGNSRRRKIIGNVEVGIRNQGLKFLIPNS